MKKSILKSKFFLLGGLILTHLLAYVAESLAPDGNILFLLNDQKHIKLLLAQSQNIEAMAIGNSHAGSIHLKTLGFDGYKLVRPDADFFELQYYLEKLIPRLPNVKTVFVAVSYFSFHRDNAVSEEARIRRTHMYTAMPSWQFIEGDEISFVIGKSHLVLPIKSIIRKDNWKGVFDAIFDGAEREKAKVEISEDDCRYMGVEDLHKFVNKRVRRHIQLTTEMVANYPNLDADTYAILTEIVNYLQARNIRAIFFTPPYSEAFNKLYESIDPEAIVVMRRYMETLQRKYGIEYYDFSMDQEFTSNLQLFADGDHLNGCGAKVFSTKFKQIMVGNERLVWDSQKRSNSH